jgi:hypothetical protein
LKNGVEIAGATSQTFEAVDPGTYSVKVSSGDCSTESDPTTITAAEQLFSSTINVYPNPAHSSVRVELQRVVQMAKVDVYTLTGRKKESIFLVSKEGKSAAEFDVKSYAAGIYVLIITSPDGTVTKKLRVLCCAE